MRAAKVQASLRIRAVSPEPPLLAHTSIESRGTFRQKARSLAPLNIWACAVKTCHNRMLEDTNSLDGAQLSFFRLIFVRFKDCDAAKQAIVLWGDELRLRRAEEKQPPPPSKKGGDDRRGDRGGDRGGGRSRSDRDEMLVNSRQRRHDGKYEGGRKAGRKNDLDYESDYGAKSVRQNGYAEEGKKVSIWAKVRQAESENETEKTDIRSSVTEKVQFNSNTNSNAINNIVNSVPNNPEDTQGSTWSKRHEVTNEGLLGRNPEDKNSQLLDNIAQPPESQKKGLLGESPNDLRSTTMNGLLAGPMVTVPLGRAAILGRQATGHSSYVNPGPISRPSTSSINQQQKASPVIQQEQAEPKISSSAISQPAPAVINTQKPNSVSPRVFVEKVKDDNVEKEGKERKYRKKQDTVVFDHNF